jgi:hypothetical protein
MTVEIGCGCDNAQKQKWLIKRDLGTNNMNKMPLKIEKLADCFLKCFFC